jgi:putative mRNA 3-end processing factor
MATAMVSGWMQVRGRRRFRAVDRGFVLSDHADWDGLLATIAETGASRVSTTHGYSEPFARYLREECGLDAEALPTRYGDGDDDARDTGADAPR